jgi:pimeloyl-ACP methyl ester carboxylesterase
MATAEATAAVRFREGVVGLSDLALLYVECGTGRPLVFLHGFTDSWHSFRRVLPGLAAHRRCLALDQRGHGGSAYAGGDLSPTAFAADAAGFIEDLGLGPVAVIGHSMGSLVARNLARARPELVDRLVLVGAPLRIDTPAVRELAIELSRFGPAVPRPFAEAFQAACVHDRASVPGAFFNACVDASTGVPSRVWQATLAGLLADDSTAGLDAIACPALVLGGEEDAFFGPGEQEELARALPRGRLLLYEGVGHSPHWEAPARFIADVQAFLDAG